MTSQQEEMPRQEEMPLERKTRKQKLLERKAQIDKELKLMENKEKTADRKKDTRRKILVGAFIQKMLPDEWEKIIKSKDFEAYLVRKIDRDAFGLAPLPSDKKDKGGKTERTTTSHKGEKQEHKAEHKAPKSEPTKAPNDGTFTIPDDHDELWSADKVDELTTKRGTFIVKPDREIL